MKNTVVPHWPQVPKMDKVSEETQHREIELRERSRRIQAIESRLRTSSTWDVAIEIEDLNRRILELERAK